MNKKKEVNIGDIIFWKVYDYYDYRLKDTYATQWAFIYKVYTNPHGDKMLSVYLINDALGNLPNQYFASRTTEVPFMYVNVSVTIYDSSIYTIDQ